MKCKEGSPLGCGECEVMILYPASSGGESDGQLAAACENGKGTY